MIENLTLSEVTEGTIFNNTLNISSYTNNIFGHYNMKTNTIIFNNGDEWYKTPFNI